MRNTTTSRRAILAGAAAIPALSLPAIAGTDPAFAAIEKFKAADAENEKVLMLEPARPALASADYPAWEKKNEAACYKCLDALNEMLATRPTTRAGAVALIGCLLDVWGERTDDGDMRALLQTLAKAIPRLA